MVYRARTSAFIGLVALGAGLMSAPNALAGEVGTRGCPPEVWYKVVTYKPTYETIGQTAGKYNSSPTNSRLTYEKSTTTTKESKYGTEMGGSLDWGIGKVEAKTSYENYQEVREGDEGHELDEYTR